MRWDRERAAMQAAVRRHDAIKRAAIASRAGHVFKTIGDAFSAALTFGAAAIERERRARVRSLRRV